MRPSSSMLKSIPLMCATAALAVLMFTSTASAYVILEATVAEAMTRANAWIQKDPDNAAAHFFLGTILGSSWANGVEGDAAMIGIDGGNSLKPPPWVSILYTQNPALPVTPESLGNLAHCISEYQKAAHLDPKTPRYELALAWAFDEAGKTNLNPADIPGAPPIALNDQERVQIQTAIAHLTHQNASQRDLGVKTLTPLMPRAAGLLLAVKSDDPDVTRRIASIFHAYWLSQATLHYRKAYAMSVAQDLAAKEYDMEADNTVSVPAGRWLLKVLPTQPDVKQGELDSIHDAIKTITSKPQRLINY